MRYWAAVLLMGIVLGIILILGSLIAVAQYQ